MKTEIERKLDKLPASIYDPEDNCYDLIIRRYGESKPYGWIIEYIDFSTENTFLRVNHNSLQAAVDTTLKEIKNL